MICRKFETLAVILLLTCEHVTVSQNLYQPKSFIENPTNRYRRQISQCETWSSWVDINHPFNIGDSDEEHFNEYDLESLCPANLGSITGFQCKDDRGEPRSNIFNETSKDGLYSFSCYDYTIGVKCVAQKPNGKCPDFAINIFCNCTAGPRSLRTPATTNTTTTTATPTTTTLKTKLILTQITTLKATPITKATTKRPTTKITPPKTTTDFTTITTTSRKATTSTKATPFSPFTTISSLMSLYRIHSSSSKVSTSATLNPLRTTVSTSLDGAKSTGNDPNVFHIGSLFIQWWQLLLIVAIFLFLVSVSISICLYRRGTKILRSKREDLVLHAKRVHPLDLI